MTGYATTRTLTDAVIGVLSDAGLTVKDADRGDQDAPCVVVYPGTSITGGPVGDPEADGQSVYHCIYVGTSREQAEWLRDKGRAAILASARTTMGGRAVQRVSLDVDLGVQREDDVQPPLFNAVDRYRLWHFPT